MKQPSIKHRVCEYNGKLWVIDAVAYKMSYTVIEVRLVDGDDVCFAEMTQAQYLDLNAAIPEQEFVILPAVAPPPLPKRTPRVAKGENTLEGWSAIIHGMGRKP